MAEDIFDTLDALIRSRKGSDPASSYTASLFTKGRAKIAQKLGEEATETVIAAVAQGRKELTGEAADLVYHLLVLLADADVRLDDVRAELAKRLGTSGHDEKASRSR